MGLILVFFCPPTACVDATGNQELDTDVLASGVFLSQFMYQLLGEDVDGGFRDVVSETEKCLRGDKR